MRILGLIGIIVGASVLVNPSASQADPVWWQCTAHGHGQDAFDRNFNVQGAAGDRNAAAAAALASCERIGSGCVILSCHRGL